MGKHINTGKPNQEDVSPQRLDKPNLDRETLADDSTHKTAGVESVSTHDNSNMDDSVIIEPFVSSRVRELVRDRMIANGDYPRIGKYQIQKLLSDRGMAKVFLGFDPDLQRQVTIKYYTEKLSAKQTAQVKNEGRALALIDSPFVAKCYGVEQLGNQLYLVLEYVNGQDLIEYRSKHDLTTKQVISITKNLAEGLRAIHQRGILHRDLKPSNVIVQDDGTAKIIDLGLAKEIQQREVNETAGTPAYMPPEQARNEVNSIDQRSDIFGLGGILYFLLTGRAPFEAESKAESLALARTGEVAPAGLPALGSAHLNQLCVKCLNLRPQQRFNSVGDLIKELNRLDQNPYVRSRMPLIATCLVLLIVFSVIGWRWIDRNGRDVR